MSIREERKMQACIDNSKRFPKGHKSRRKWLGRYRHWLLRFRKKVEEA